MPIMLALCLMLLHTYYAKNYAGIIDSGLFNGETLRVGISMSLMCQHNFENNRYIPFLVRITLGHL